MPEVKLNPKQGRTLIQLAFREGRVAKVGDLKPDLESKLRQDLVDQKLIDAKKFGRGTALELTDAGWRWVMENLDSELPLKEQVAALLMDILKRLNGFLRANHVDVQDVVFKRQVFHRVKDAPTALAAPPTSSAKEALMRAAEELGGVQAPQIRLRDLRPKLQDYSRQQVDSAIRELQMQEVISVIPIDLPTAIDDQDREASIDIAGKPRHAIIVRGR